jgi:hypothetical protein
LTICMKKKTVFRLLIAALFCASLGANAQVTIGSGEMPDAGALLDLRENADGSSAKGLLLPRVALVALDNPSPLPGHVAGMYVYNTTHEGNLQPGNYINDGKQWVRVKDTYTEPWLNSDTGDGAMEVGEAIYHSGALGMGTAKADASAQVEIASTSKGMLIPRLSKAERDAIANPANGFLVFNTTSECINYWNAPVSRWLSLCGTYDPATISLISCAAPAGPSTSLTAGAALTLSNTYTIPVNVSEIGTYDITVRTTNGYAYSKSGLFTSTGNYDVVLEGMGAPVAAGDDAVSITFNGVAVTPPCNMPSVKVNPATIELTMNCANVVAKGIYAAGIGLDNTNYIELEVNVTNPGSVVIETTSANGMKFSSGSINLASTGVQTVKLYGGGTPVRAGTYSFDIICEETGGCEDVSINVITLMGTFDYPANRCQEILDENAAAVDGYYWVKEANGAKFKTYCDMEADGAWTLIKSMSERQILVTERTQNESFATQRQRNAVTTETGKFNEYAFSLSAATVNNIGNSANVEEKKIKFTIKEQGHTTAAAATYQEIESSTVNPADDAWAQENYWVVTMYGNGTNNNPAMRDYSSTNNITEGKIFGHILSKPSADNNDYYFDGVKFDNDPPGMYSDGGFFTGFYGTPGAIDSNATTNNITYTYHDRTNPEENGKEFIFNEYYVNDLFGIYMGSEWELNHHIGTCANSQDDFGGASYCNGGWNNWRAHKFNQRPDGNYEGRIIQYWVK